MHNRNPTAFGREASRSTFPRIEDFPSWDPWAKEAQAFLARALKDAARQVQSMAAAQEIGLEFHPDAFVNYEGGKDTVQVYGSMIAEKVTPLGKIILKLRVNSSILDERDSLYREGALLAGFHLEGPGRNSPERGVSGASLLRGAGVILDPDPRSIAKKLAKAAGASLWDAVRDAAQRVSPEEAPKSPNALRRFFKWVQWVSDSGSPPSGGSAHPLSPVFVSPGKSWFDRSLLERRASSLGGSQHTPTKRAYIPEPCRGVSYAWVSPQGDTHKITGHVDDHEVWASNHITWNPQYFPEGSLDRPKEALMEAGWLRVSNVYNITYAGNPSPRAWGAVVDIILEECAPEYGFSPQRLVRLVSRGMERISVEDFVYNHGGRRKLDKLFESLMSRMASLWGPTVEEDIQGWLPRTSSVKEARTYSRIAMFDFDGTLFRSWEKTPDWWHGTHLDKGPYSFFSLAESLDEPCVPDDPPSNFWISEPVQAARKAVRAADTFTVVITGRVGVHRSRVVELLRSNGINPDQLYFNPGMDAAKFKVAVLKALLAGHQMVSKIDIWENENISIYDSALRATSKALGHPLEIETHQVHESPKELECSPADFGLPSQNTNTGFQPRMAANTGDRKSVGLFIPLPQELAAQFPKKEKDTSPQHVTFLYVGEVPPEREQEFLGVLENIFLNAGAVQAVLDGVGSFQSQTNKVVFSKVRFSEDLSALRDRAREALETAGFEVQDSWQMYQPHSTIEYLDDPFQIWTGTPPQGSWEFNSLEVWGLPDDYEVSFGTPIRLRGPVPEIGLRRVARIQAIRASRP
jgi:2'-5' RNA ligase